MANEFTTPTEEQTNYDVAKNAASYITHLINSGSLYSATQFEPSLRVAQIHATLALVDAVKELKPRKKWYERLF